MKRLLLTIFLLLSLPGILCAEDGLFKGLQINHICLTWADYTTTSLGIEEDNYREVNPVARYYIKHPMQACIVNLAVSTLTHWGTSVLYKRNKTLGYVLIIGLNLVRGYVFYRNIQEIKRF